MEAQVSEVCERIHYGYTDSADHAGNGLKFLRISDIQDGTVNWDTVPACSLAVKDAASFLLRKGDILFARTGGTVGKSFLVAHEPPASVFASYLIRLIPRSDIDSAYIAQYFQSSAYWAQIGLNKTGLKTNVNASILGSLDLPLPPLNEQKRIVAKIEELFSGLDAGDESLRRARRQLGVYRQSLLKQAFEGKLTNNWRGENSSIVGSDAVPSVETGESPPRGWRSTSLGRVIEAPAYGTSKKCSYESGGHGVLRIPNVVNGTVDANDLKFAEFTDDEVLSYKLNAGDLLVIRSNGSVSIVGRCALIEPKHTPFLYAGYLIRLRPIKSWIDPVFLRAQLTSPMVRSQIEFSAKSTSGVNNINSKEIQRLVISLPPLPEQQEIVRLLDEQFTVIEQNEREIDTALKRSGALRQSILKKAFSGQLVAQDPADEPAGVLLERIRREREEAGPGAGRRRSAGLGGSAGSDGSTGSPGAPPPVAAPVFGGDFFPEIASAKPPRKPAVAPGGTDLQAGIVALAMVAHEGGEERLGHVKAEKIVHLCDVIARLRLDRHPVKDAAGPNDFPKAKKVEHRAEMKGWFTVRKEPGGEAYRYRRGPNFERLVRDTEARLGDQLLTVRGLIDELALMSWRKAELVATVHAAWNNLLLAGGTEPTEEAIVWEARENWHPDKLDIEEVLFFEAIAWIRSNGVEPAGTGAVVPAKVPGSEGGRARS